MKSSEFVNSEARFKELTTDPAIDVEEVRIMADEDWLLVGYKPKKEAASRTGSVVLAALTTAYARMRLYQVINAYSDHVVYMDTDSGKSVCMYICGIIA